MNKKTIIIFSSLIAVGLIGIAVTFVIEARSNKVEAVQITPAEALGVESEAEVETRLRELEERHLEHLEEKQKREAEIEELKKQGASYKELIQMMTEAQKQKGTLIDEMQRKVETLATEENQSLNEARVEIDRLTTELAAAQRSIEDGQTQAKQLQVEMDRVIAELEETRDALKAREQAVGELNSEIEAFSTPTSEEIQVGYLRDQLEEVRAQLDMASKQRNEYLAASDLLEIELKNTQDDLEKLTERFNEEVESNEVLTKSVDYWKTLAEEGRKEADLVTQKQIEDLQEKNSSLNTTIKELEAKVAEKGIDSEEFDKLQAMFADEKARRQALEEKIETLQQGKGDGLGLSNEKEVKQLTAEIERLQNELRKERTQNTNVLEMPAHETSPQVDEALLEPLRSVPIDPSAPETDDSMDAEEMPLENEMTEEEKMSQAELIVAQEEAIQMRRKELKEHEAKVRKIASERRELMKELEKIKEREGELKRMKTDILLHEKQLKQALEDLEENKRQQQIVEYERHKIETSRAQLKELERELDFKTNAMRERRDELKKMSATLGFRNQELNYAKRRLEIFTSERSSILKQFEMLKDQENSLERRRKELEREEDRLESVLSTLNLNEELAKIRVEFHETDVELQRAQNTKDDMVRELEYIWELETALIDHTRDLEATQMQSNHLLEEKEFITRKYEILAKKFDELEEVHQKDRATFFYNMGLSYSYVGLYKDAAIMYEKALEINPSDPATHYNLGIIYEEHLDQVARGVMHYREYIQYSQDETKRNQVKIWVDMADRKFGSSRTTHSEDSSKAFGSLFLT